MLLKSFAELPARKRIGIVAIILGVISIFAGDPNSNVNSKVNLKDLSLISADEISEISVQDLSDWLIKGKMDYRLIDLRSEEDYNKYRIPSAENIKVNELLKSDLSRNNKILLYSDNDVEATQGWFLLKSNHYKGVNVIKGGIEKWKNEILFPSCTCGENPSVEQKHKHAKLAEVSEFFGGKMQESSIGSDEPKMAMPEIQAPAQIVLKKASGRKKREGC